MTMRTWFNRTFTFPRMPSFRNPSKSASREGSGIPKSREGSKESVFMKGLSGQDAENAMSLGARTTSELELGSSAENLSRRRASASVEEIRNLYSALQELVPVPAHSAPTPKVNEPENATEQAVKPTLLEIPKENCLQVQQPRKRLLPTPPGSPRVSNKDRRAPGNDAPVNGVKYQSDAPVNGGKNRSDAPVNGGKNHGQQSPGLVRKSLEGDVKLGVSRKGSNSSNLISFLRRRSTGNCLTPDTNTTEVTNVDVKAKKAGKSSPFVKRKLLSPFTRRRGSTPNLVIVNTEEEPSPPLKPTSLKAATQSPTVSRRGSLADAINMLSKTDNIEVLLRDTQRQNYAQGPSLRESEGASRGGSQKSLGMMEGQMELLLRSLDELQDAAGSSPNGAQPTDSEIIQRLEERRGSLGTEMRELLDALRELMEANSHCPNSPASSIGPSSRRSSFYESVNPTQRESLDSLEAYFNEKLRNATKAKSPPNAFEMPPNASEMSPNASEMPPNVFECHVFDDQELLDQTDGAQAEQQWNSDAPPAMMTTIEQIEAEERTEVVRPSKSPEDLEPCSCKAEAQLDRKQWKKEQREFAVQVNGKLEEWLTRATALSTKDKTPCEAQQGVKGTGDKSSKRKVFSKRSFKRQREKNKEEYRTRRSQSLHDIFADEGDHGNDDDQQQEDAATEKAGQIPDGLVASVARSKSMQDAATNNKKKRSFKRYVSHESSNSKACVDIVSTPRASQGATEQQNHGRASPVALHSNKGARKPRILPKDPVLMRQLSNEQPASAQSQPSGDGSLGHAQRKRSSRLPMDLPLFYSPMAGSAVPDDCSSQQDLGEASYKELSCSTPDIKKSLFPQATKRYSGNFDLLYGAKPELFCIDKEPNSASGNSCRSVTSHASHFTLDVNNGHLQNSRFDSRAMPFFCKENSRESQTLQRVASHDSLPDYSDDYRDGTRSESDDSGCPGNEFNAVEIAVQTKPLSQFNERDRVQENIERPESLRTLRRLRSNSRRSSEVSDLGVTV